LSDQTRLAFKQQLLEVTAQQVKSITEKYFSSDRSATGVAVIASQQHLESANEQLDKRPLVLHTI
jgi:Zn-dependent M16 (insulinase) family peptidase